MCLSLRIRKIQPAVLYPRTSDILIFTGNYAPLGDLVLNALLRRSLHFVDQKTQVSETIPPLLAPTTWRLGVGKCDLEMCWKTFFGPHIQTPHDIQQITHPIDSLLGADVLLMNGVPDKSVVSRMTLPLPRPKQDLCQGPLEQS